ncbi:MAG: hypothetical protein QM820_23915 [Minicystis sp.]
METNIEHKVRQTHVPKKRPLMPIFEAIVNSIQAIEDSAVRPGFVRVEIVRASTPRVGETATMESIPDSPVSGFTIKDNGVGFDRKNYASFNCAESPHKLERGGKGVGRFLWLAAFREALVISTYRTDGGELRRRKFRFTISPKGVNDISDELAPEGAETGSTIHLIDVSDNVASLRSFPRDARKIAEAIAEHCTGYLLREWCPSIDVVDGVTTISVNAIFAESALRQSEEQFALSGQDFRMVVVKTKPAGGETPHRVRLYGNCREVQNYALAEDLPQLPRRIVDSGRGWVADVYVFGRYLDNNLDNLRSRFNFEEAGADGSETFGWDVTMPALRRTIAERVGEALRQFIQPEQDRWRETVKKHIQGTSPRYGVLLNVAEKQLDELPINLTVDRLEGELAKILYQHRQRVDQELDRALESDQPVADHVNRLVAQVQDVQRSQLAEYVMLRHAILSYLQKALRKDPITQKWPAEAILHDLIFPRRATSNTVKSERTNLWIFDERLSFGDEILSDIPIDVTDGHSPAPDIVIYDRIVAVADGERPRNVMIFEFKKPGRTDYGPGVKRDPVGQLQDEVSKLREGSIVTPDGTVRTVPDTVPIFAYLIADATEPLRKHLRKKGWIASADGQTHVDVDIANKVFYQHLTWAEAIGAAVQRNSAFFEKLGLPPPR